MAKRAKNHESLRGLHDLHVLLVLCEFGRPAKRSEIEDITNFLMTSMTLSFFAKRGYVDHDRRAHTWCINDAGRAYAFEVSQRETQKYHSWKKSQK
jgi:hypothetical protein